MSLPRGRAHWQRLHRCIHTAVLQRHTRCARRQPPTCRLRAAPCCQAWQPPLPPPLRRRPAPTIAPDEEAWVPRAAQQRECGCARTRSAQWWTGTARALVEAIEWGEREERPSCRRRHDEQAAPARAHCARGGRKEVGRAAPLGASLSARARARGRSPVAVGDGLLGAGACTRGVLSCRAG